MTSTRTLRPQVMPVRRSDDYQVDCYTDSADAAMLRKAAAADILLDSSSHLRDYLALTLWRWLFEMRHAMSQK